MIEVDCPCCHGKKYLTVIEHDEEDGRTILTRPMCCHCTGTGKVLTELPFAETAEYFSE